MKSIYKYTLEITDSQSISMPRYAQILSVAKQGDSLCLWAEVFTEEEQVHRHIRIIGTGNPIEGSPNRVFLGTVVMDPFVWHVFEVIQ